MENPKLFSNLYGKNYIEIMDSVPNWQVCGYGFKGWNDPYPTMNKTNSFIFYTYEFILAIDSDGNMSIFRRSTKQWSSIAK